MFQTLKSLVMMQLKDKIDLSFLSTRKKLISKVVLSILSVVLVVTIEYFLFYFSKILKVFSFLDMVPVSVVVVVFTIMQILSIITCTYQLMKNLYFAKDNQVLLTFPVTTNQIFISKLIVFYIYELIKNVYFIFPLFFAYGLISGFSFWFFLWLIFCVAIISLIPVCIGALLSIFAMGITMFLKNYSVIRWIVFATVAGGVVFGIIYIIGLIPENIDIVGSWGTLYWDIQDFLAEFTKIFYPFTKIVEFVCGTYSGLVPVLFSLNTLYVFLSIVGFVVVMFGLSFLISRPIFFKMASTPFEYKRKLSDKTLQNKVYKPFYSSVRKENLTIFRTADEVYNLFGIAIAMPILILLLNKIFASMSTRLMGDFMAVSFNLLIIVLIAMASNNQIASIFSREGAAGYLIKTRPNSYHKSLVAKFITYAVVITISIIISVVVFSIYNSLSTINVILLCLSAIFIYLNHLLWSAEMDIMNPQNAQYATTGNHVSNPNETKSTIAMVFLAFLFTFISFMLSVENIKVSWLKVCLIALVLLGYRVWSFYSKIKYYYGEK